LIRLLAGVGLHTETEHDSSNLNGLEMLTYITIIGDPDAEWIPHYVPVEITLMVFGKILTACRNASNAN
jgi:hypothetical protein